MSKDIIKARAKDKKAATDLLELRQRLAARPELTAKEARSLADAEGGQTIDDKANAAWTTLMRQVKEAAGAGLSMLTVNGIINHHPDVRDAVVKRLDKAGFKHELAGATGYIYW